MTDERFDKLLADMRDETATAEQINGARQRVWDRLASARSLACDDLRPSLADYAAGRLTESRRLLTEDHLSRCVDCRHALAEVKGTRNVAEMPLRRAVRRPAWTRWAVAAGIVLTVLYVGRSSIDSALSPGGPQGTIVSVSGTLYQPSGAALEAGAELADGDIVRTAAGSRAVLALRDGSRVEINERTELSLHGARSGDTIRLGRGDIIVEAADQGRDRLRVMTRDSIASVKGTVFAVSSGTVGSLVSVVEGSVEVSHAGNDELLIAGQQAASNPALSTTGVLQAVSWSEASGTYADLLVEFSRIEERLAASTTAMSRQSGMVSYIPSGTTVYVAIPNLEGTVGEALEAVDQRTQQNGALRDWWASESGRAIETMLLLLQGVTGMLGDEMAFVLTGSQDPMPLLLARVAPGREQDLRAVIDQAAAISSQTLPYQVSDGLLLASDTPGNLALLALQLGSGAAAPFATQIAQRYGRGVGWLAALDVEALGAEHRDSEASRLLGISNMRYLFLEQRSGAAGAESEATLSFSGDRQGLVSWLAAPGSIGSAEYVSADAFAASSGSTRDPYEAIDQLFSTLGPESELVREISQLELDTGIDLRDDVAAALGTDFVLALDGISVIGPAFVGVFEVVNAGAFDEAVRRLVDTINAQAGSGDSDSQLSFTQEQSNGRTWNVLASTETGETLNWTYDRGYLVGSTERGVALRAIGVRDSGSSLVRSARFQQQFPSGAGIHNSGFLWLDLSALSGVLEAIGQQVPSFDQQAEPVLVVITGENDRIHWASRARLTSLIFDLLLITE